MSSNTDDESYPITLFAARLVGEEGWIVGEEAMKPDQVAEAFRENGQELEEFRVISRGAGRKWDENGEPDLSHSDYWQAQADGWSYDELADCWRAPGENVTPFESVPKSVTTVDVEFGTTHSGWLPIRMSAGDQKFEIDASELYPPFEDLIAWLESIVEAKEARFTADLEGSYAEFFAFETAIDDRVRVVVALSENLTEDGDRKIVLDIDVDRVTFAGRLYRSLRTYANGPDFNRYEWAAVSIHEDLHERFPEFPANQLRYSSASEVNEVLWKLYPRDIVSFPEKGSRGEEIRAFAEWVRDGEGKDPEGMVRTPDPQFVVPDEFDTWDLDKRKAHLDELFENNITSWHGEDLRKLHSEKIERFLQLGAK